MATVFTTHHAHHGTSGLRAEAKTKNSTKGTVAVFVSDLLEDIQETPLQAAKYAKHDMFKEHINAMSISYFALIVLLIAGSVPLLGWAVQTLVPY
jgi:hypothetical protein